MSSFGKWYGEQKDESSSTNGNSSSSALNFSGIFKTDSRSDDSTSSNTPTNSGNNGSSMMLPLFNTSVQVPSTADFSFTNLKSSLEAQMPQQILGMNYQQRFKVFVSLLILSGVFFALGIFVGFPVLMIRPQKFALSFTCGSLTFMGSFSILRGPSAHMSSMLVAERLPFTTVYIGSMLLTLYFTFNAGGPKGYVLVLLMSGVQLMALLWYLLTFLPGGAQGMKIITAAIVTIMRPLIVGCTKCCTSVVIKVFGRAFW